MTNSEIVTIKNLGNFPRNIFLVIETETGSVFEGNLQASGRFVTLQEGREVSLVRVNDISSVRCVLPNETFEQEETVNE